MNCVLFSLFAVYKPNKSVKGTRRPVAVLKFCFYQGFGLRLAFAGGAPLTVTLGFWGNRLNFGWCLSALMVWPFFGLF